MCGIRPFICFLISLLLTALTCKPLQAGTRAITVPQPPVPSIRAVIVGINNYENIESLEYAAGDARLIQETLLSLDTALIRPDNITLLLDQEATYSRIISELRATDSDSRQSLLFYWAGRSAYDRIEDDLFLLPHDTILEGGKPIKTLSLLNDIAPLSEGRDVIFLGDGSQIGDGLFGRTSREYPRFSTLAASKVDEEAIDGFRDLGHSVFSYFMAEALSKPAPDIDGDGFISLEEIHHYVYPLVSAMSMKYSRPQHPTVAGSFIHRQFISQSQPASAEFDLDEIPDELTTENLLVNGYRSKARIEEATSRISFLSGDDGHPKPGLNIFQAGRAKVLFWLEGKKLMKFSRPYEKSRAIIVAIDNYERRLDPERGATGLRQLSNMVERAEQLKYALLNLGFDDDNITTLYDSEATSEAIERELRLHWKGGKEADVDRLFFYFGGHGIVENGQAYMATYDYDKLRPTLTSFYLNDLVERHAQNIVSRHMFAAIDVCYAGLAWPRPLAGAVEQLKVSDEFYKLSIIRADIDQPARNILLAGTEN